MTQSKTKCKFRISLSPEQIQWILSHDDCPSELKKQLSLHLFKINQGLVAPAFTVQSFASLPADTKYKKVLAKLGEGKELNAEEQEAYDQYRYENGTMNDEEMAQYEQEKLGW